MLIAQSPCLRRHHFKEVCCKDSSRLCRVLIARAFYLAEVKNLSGVSLWVKGTRNTH